MPYTEQDLLDAKVYATKAESRLANLQFHELRVKLAERDAQPDRALTYHFYHEISTMPVAHAITEIGTWSRLHPGAPIKIVFTSPGGSVFDGVALYDFIQELRAAGHHVTTKVIGFAASMGGVLLQAGDVRVATPRSWMMIHEVSGHFEGKASEARDYQKLLDRLEEQIIDILGARSTLPKEVIKERWSRKDWWLDAGEMLDGGFVDEIE